MRKCLVALAWLAAAPALWAAGVDFEARLWAPDLGGVARVDGGGGASTIDLGSDLGFADDEAIEGRLIWRPSRRASVRLDWAGLDFSATALLERSVTFAGTTFQLDAQVSSVLEMDYGGLGFAWQPVSTRDGRLRLGPLVEARGMRGEASLRADLLGILPLSAREEFEVAFGAAGALLDAEPTRKLHFSLRWVASIGADEGNLTDLEAAVRFLPTAALAITVGYRRVEIDATEGDDLLDLELDGPFFGGVLRF